MLTLTLPVKKVSNVLHSKMKNGKLWNLLLRNHWPWLLAQLHAITSQLLHNSDILPQEHSHNMYTEITFAEFQELLTRCACTLYSDTDVNVALDMFITEDLLLKASRMLPGRF